MLINVKWIQQEESKLLWEMLAIIQLNFINLLLVAFQPIIMPNIKLMRL